MNASEARALTARNLTGPVIEPFLRHVHRRIEEAAAKGQSSISHPLQGSGPVWPSSAAVEALWAALRKEGYTVRHHEDPDPGHPASGPYDEVSW